MRRKKYKLGLVIGRFQPFHFGHKYLIDQALNTADMIIIGIGSANRSDDDNPLGAIKRRKIIQKFIEHEGLGKRIKKIVLLHDNSDDDVWFENLIKKTGKFDVTIGNNPWNNGIIERHGIPAVTIGFKNRHRWEGVKIRKLIREGKTWRNRVPEYLATFIRENYSLKSEKL